MAADLALLSAGSRVAGRGGPARAAVFWLGAALMTAGIPVYLLGARFLRVARLDGERVWCRGASPGFLARLSERRDDRPRTGAPTGVASGGDGAAGIMTASPRPAGRRARVLANVLHA